MTVDISNNAIASLLPLAGASRLRTLNASYNRVATLLGLGSCTSLNKVDVQHNALDTLEGLAPVATCPLLGAITLAGNGVRDVLDYRLHLVHMLPQVRCDSCMAMAT